MRYRFIPFEESTRPQWDAFVGANPHAWVGHDSAILELAEGQGSRSLSHLALDPHDHVVAVVPLFIDSIRLARFLRFRTLRTSYSLRGGPLLAPSFSASMREGFWDEWHAWTGRLARREGIDLVQLSLPNFLGPQPISDFYPYCPLLPHGYNIVPSYSLIVTLDAAASFTGRYTRSCRKNINHAEREGVEFRVISERSEWMALHPLNVAMYRSKNVPPLSEETFALLWDRFVARSLAQAFALRYRDQWITASLSTGTRHSWYHWYMFNDPSRPVRGANNLLVHRLMQHFSAQGVEHFEIGSLDFETSEENQRISQFKLSFGAEVRHSINALGVVSGMKYALAQLLIAANRSLDGARRRARREEPEGAEPPEPPSGE